MYKFLVACFDALERVITAVDSGWRRAWRRFRDGPLQNILFALIIFLTGILVLVRATLEELDELLAGLEKGVISIALLAMTALSFLDYLRREVPGVDFSIQGGANMAVVLMVWVGFLGASLATRQRKHLAVDASDRILSPRAARMTKRFSGIAAAVFC
ncbi:MAG: TRAP transporter small permease subunit, partial [Myxococcota bacterium]|nr:TRAP transporter small permease subunit [Myxococcota bacterium]